VPKHDKLSFFLRLTDDRRERLQREELIALRSRLEVRVVVVRRETDAGVDDSKGLRTDALESTTIQPKPDGHLTPPNRRTMVEVSSTPNCEGRPCCLPKVDESHLPSTLAITEPFDDLTPTLFLSQALFFLSTTTLFFETSTFGFDLLPDLDTESRIEGRSNPLNMPDGTKPIEVRLKDCFFGAKRELLPDVDERTLLERTTCRNTDEAIEPGLDEVDRFRGPSHLGDARDDPNTIRDDPVTDQVALHDVPEGLVRGLRRTVDPCLAAVELERVPADLLRKTTFDGPRSVLGAEGPSSDPRRGHPLILCLKKIPPSHGSPHAAASAQTGFLSSSVFMIVSTRETRTTGAAACALPTGVAATRALTVLGIA